MSTETTRKPTPALLTESLTLTLNHLTLGDLNAYRQATHAEQWPPVDLTGLERLEYIKQQRQLADQAALGVALFLNDQIVRHLDEQIQE
jgi:hypothetical protein